jgi:hypothetical protein
MTARRFVFRLMHQWATLEEATMSRFPLACIALGLMALGCDRVPTESVSGDDISGPQFAAGGVVHRASVGSHDFTDPGVDANFSLVAIQHSDGSISGQYTDRFAQGGGFHAQVTCLSVDGNTAWIGGIIRGGDFNGQEVITEVQDNGTSTNDAPDLISFSFIGVPAQTCLTQPALPLFPLQGGEVKVE